MLLELFLGLTAATIGYNIYRTRKVQNRLHLLESHNASLTEAMMLPPASGDDLYQPHEWRYVGEEAIHYSVFSMESVCIRVEKCSTCGLIHRYISDGYQLARRKGLTDVEGYYINGLRVADPGCRTPSS